SAAWAGAAAPAAPRPSAITPAPIATRSFVSRALRKLIVSSIFDPSGMRELQVIRGREAHPTRHPRGTGGEKKRCGGGIAGRAAAFGRPTSLGGRGRSQA